MKGLRAGLFALALLTTTGATCSRTARPAVPALCEPVGFEQCESKARWEGDPEDPRAWDALAGETLSQSREETRTCEVRRKALEQCLRRLDRERVIDLGRTP